MLNCISRFTNRSILTKKLDPVVLTSHHSKVSLLILFAMPSTQVITQSHHKQNIRDSSDDKQGLDDPTVLVDECTDSNTLEGERPNDNRPTSP
jgi:hypothetical protein